MTQFNDTATDDLRSLILSTCNNPGAEGDQKQVHARLIGLLKEGANPNASSVQGLGVILDDLTHFPSLALSLLDHGARLSPSGLVALRDNFTLQDKINLNVFHPQHPFYRENAQRMRHLAALQPDLDWYAKYATKGGPWAIALERGVKGLNGILENARINAGVPLYMPSDKEDRISALLELAEPTNPHVWIENKDRLTLLDELMGEDISPDYHLPISTLSLFGRYMYRSSGLARAVLERGAVLTQYDMNDFLDFLSENPTNFHIYDLVPDVLDRLDQWAHLKPTHGSGSMFDYFLEIAPEEYASWQANKMDEDTPVISHSTRSRRL